MLAVLRQSGGCISTIARSAIDFHQVRWPHCVDVDTLLKSFNIETLREWMRCRRTPISGSVSTHCSAFSLYQKPATASEASVRASEHRARQSRLASSSAGHGAHLAQTSWWAVSRPCGSNAVDTTFTRRPPDRHLSKLRHRCSSAAAVESMASTCKCGRWCSELQECMQRSQLHRAAPIGLMYNINDLRSPYGLHEQRLLGNKIAK